MLAGLLLMLSVASPAACGQASLAAREPRRVSMQPHTVALSETMALLGGMGECINVT